ncbi:winged helix-turn-helix transcriptional regulator [Halobacteriales archaeon Cl-PHB]
MSVEDTDAEVKDRNRAACPTVHAIGVIGETWRLNVLYGLRQGEKRFNELKRATGASSRTLSQALDALQEADLVRRRSEEADPIAVFYGLTEKGEDLEPVFAELEDWAEKHDHGLPADSPVLADD